MNNAPPIILDAANSCSPLSIPASKTALLLLDFHTFIVSSQPPSTSKSVVSSAVALREWACEHDILIIHCLIDLKASTPLSRKMAKRANSVRDRFSNQSENSSMGEIRELGAQADEYTFWRPPSHVSALGSYGIKDFLSQYEIESLILAGFSTSGCVVNTAKDAADRGYVVTVVKDACGDKVPEVHDIVVEKLLVGQCHVAEREVFVKAWKGIEKRESLPIRNGYTNGM